MGFAIPKNSVMLALLYIIGSVLKMMIKYEWASQVALVVKNPSANAGDAGDTGSISG